MKSIIRYSTLSIIGISLAITSCNLLDTQPISEIPESQMWQNERDVELRSQSTTPTGRSCGKPSCMKLR